MLMAAVAYNVTKMMKWTNKKIETCKAIMTKATKKSWLKQFMELMDQLILYNKKVERLQF